MIHRFGRCDIDFDRFELRRDGEVVSVEPQVFDVLGHLVLHADRVVTKEELLDEIWGDRFVSESALTSRIKAARRAVGDDGVAQGVIGTVHGRGYRLVVPVEIVEVTADHAPPTDPSTAAVHETRYASSRGASIAYQVVDGGGDHGDVVFVPGFVSSVELQWEVPPVAAFLNRLASLGRLIVFDKRGTGLSDRIAPGEVPTLEERMEDLIAVMDAADSRQATIFGISEGGAMAVLFAAAHPERVRRLVLYGTFTRLDFVEPDQFAAFLDRLRDRWGSGSMIGRLLSPSWADDQAMRRVAARVERHAASPATAAQILALAAEFDVAGVAGAVSRPTLVLHRSSDRFVPAAAGRRLADAIPGAAFVELAGDDHLVFAGDTEAVLDEIAAFVAATDAGEPSRPSGSEPVLATIVMAAAGGEGFPSAEIGELVRRHGGASAGATALFGGPARAVRAACAIAEILGGKVGVGVHTAEVTRRGDRVEGLGVRICEDISRLCPPGAVTVSRTVCDLVAGSGLVFADRGAERLRSVGDEWELFTVVPAEVETAGPAGPAGPGSEPGPT